MLITFMPYLTNKSLKSNNRDDIVNFRNSRINFCSDLYFKKLGNEIDSGSYDNVYARDLNAKNSTNISNLIIYKPWYEMQAFKPLYFSNDVQIKKLDIKDKSFPNIKMKNNARIDFVNGESLTCEMYDDTFIGEISKGQLKLYNNAKIHKANVYSAELNDNSKIDDLVCPWVKLHSGNIKNIKINGAPNLLELPIKVLINSPNARIDFIDSNKQGILRLHLNEDICSENLMNIYGNYAIELVGDRQTNFKNVNLPERKVICRAANPIILNKLIAKEVSGYDIEADIVETEKLDCNHRVKINHLILRNCDKFIFPANADIKTITFKDRRGIVKVGSRIKKPVVNIINGKEVYCTKENYGFDNVAGMDELKKTLYNDVIYPLNFPEQYALYGLKPSNGILLYGPPGCGKTFLAEALAEEANRFYIKISPSDIASKYLGDAPRKINEIFKVAKAHSPAIVFIDEIEAICPSREYLGGDSASVDINAQITELLTEINNCSKNDIFVIAASNEPQRIDKAIKRSGRFDKRVLVAPPDMNSRIDIIKKHLENRYHSKEIDYDMIAKNTNNYVASDMKELVEQAARFAIVEEQPIKQEHFEKALQTTKPSLTSSMIKYYIDKGEA